MSYTSHTVEPLLVLDDESIFIIAYQHAHTPPRTSCSSKKQAIMIDNVPVGWKLANSLSIFWQSLAVSESPTQAIASYNIPVFLAGSSGARSCYDEVPASSPGSLSTAHFWSPRWSFRSSYAILHNRYRWRSSKLASIARSGFILAMTSYPQIVRT